MQERATYDRLWADTLASFRAGVVEIDPALNDLASDDRRGLTLAARPDAPARDRLSRLLDELRGVAPEQHIYSPDDLHITVLPVIPTGPGFELAAAPLETYRALFDDVFAATTPFTLHLRGLTAARCCVLICGYCPDGALNALRDRLREALRSAGLDDNLEPRYRITVAHASALRFRTPPACLERLTDYIVAHRDTDYGACRINTIDFVVNDWYMSHDRVRLLKRYTLGDADQT